MINVIIIIIISNLLLFLFKKKKGIIFLFNTNLVKYNEYFLSNDIKDFTNKRYHSKTKKGKNYNADNSINFSFNLTSIRYSREIRNKIIKVKYLIGFYDLNKNFIVPSDLTLYYEYHVLCYNKNLNNNEIIISLADIYENKFYYCIEFFNKNENIIFGIILYKKSSEIKYYSIDFFTYKNKKYDNFIYNIMNDFNYSLINEKFNILTPKIHYNKLDNSRRLKKSFIQKPLYSTKSNVGKQNQWIFRNILNHYFCFCKGKNCLFYNIPQKCKYYFYLSIIDNNKYIYNKTEYLFGDFFFNNLSTDDVYPIFTKMMSQNYGVHYMTKIENIYENYCKNKSVCLTIIRDTFIDGDFLEKYLTLILKLKSVISGSEFYFIDNLFYNLDYITYISVGHGVSFFKHFLYSEYNYYGFKKYNKILIPPSERLISVAKHYGWKDKNIIKMNLPRWDNYNKKKKQYVKNKNIFVMFTWRQMEEKKNISELYFENINGLLKKYYITLFFTFHRRIENKSRIKLNTIQYTLFLEAIYDQA